MKKEFRCWDKANKRWLSNSWHGNYDDLYFDDINEILKSIEDDQDYTLQQYTGLKDKKSKKIFEGDIVTSTKGENQVNGRIKYNAPAFEIVDDTGKWLEGFCDNIEVIGNIYENKELLKT